MADDEPSSADAAGDDGIWARSTAPQSPYSMRDVGLGLVIFGIGLVLTIGLPLALS